MFFVCQGILNSWNKGKAILMNANKEGGGVHTILILNIVTMTRQESSMDLEDYQLNTLHMNDISQISKQRDYLT